MAEVAASMSLGWPPQVFPQHGFPWTAPRTVEAAILQAVAALQAVQNCLHCLLPNPNPGSSITSLTPAACSATSLLGENAS